MATGTRDSTGHTAREGRHPGPHRQVSEHEPGHSWWQVVCLTGVDYFSTIGYQPAIAFLAAGLVSPLATIVLILVTLFGALPVYRRVAVESPYGEGSLAMLERILSWWTGKILVLVLLGFAATDFLITMTLSAADASAHLLENPYAPHFVHGHQFVVTLVLLAALAAVFLRGFRRGHRDRGRAGRGVPGAERRGGGRRPGARGHRLGVRDRLVVGGHE